MKESAIETKVRKYCTREGLVCYKFTSPSYNGVPDRLILGRGKVLFLELKSAKGKLTALQQRELDRIRAAGVEAKVAYSYGQAIEMIADHFVADYV